MPRLGEQELAGIAEGRELALRELGRIRERELRTLAEGRTESGLRTYTSTHLIHDDIPILLAAYREAVALNARYREALQWCLDEGGWRLTHYQTSGPPPAGVFGGVGTTLPRLLEEDETLAALRAAGAAGKE